VYADVNLYVQELVRRRATVDLVTMFEVLEHLEVRAIGVACAPGLCPCGVCAQADCFMGGGRAAGPGRSGA
jgi:hypothetical protein